ncbi:T9SS type A sorting domain-containing protein [Flavobacterium caeni]|uniref:Por secretion system C-terminal sorting domain-containing protein n=1 Tax=Flavobacterium caeni TaxID=490189 RepID=A0A1G5IKI0_9FLAO|nr:T9SS type A sorting domain-containing protein [Flavobacterium caeni]SCY76210.1 Por secretion system C-terminal sorting domain-containing protein [Flavobacterium caeni]
MKKIYTTLLALCSVATFAQTYDYTLYNWQNTNTENATVNCLTTDNNGLLWMSSFAGIASFNGTTFTNYTPENSDLPINSVTKIVVDGLNRKWMSTYQSGIIMMSGNTFTGYDEVNSGLPSNVIGDIAVDASNNVWVATDAGLAKFNGSTWTVYNESNAGTFGNNISSVGIVGSTVYIVASEAVLMKMTGSSFSPVTDGVLKIFKTTNNDLYAYTLYGFSKFVNGDLTASYDYLAGGSCLMDCQPSAIDLDENGKVWISNYVECAQGGIQNFTDCANYTHANNDPMNYVTAFKVQSSNLIWVFVAELGLVKMVGNNLSAIDFENQTTATVYPNPVQDVLHVAAPQTISDVTVYNTMGQQVLRQAIDASEGQIDMSALTPGTYFVKTATPSAVKSVKVVKQ